MSICRNCFSEPATEFGLYCVECDALIADAIIHLDNEDDLDDALDSYYPELDEASIPESHSF